MNWRGDGEGPKKGYHHGNLREALVAAALDLIASKGMGGVTFAEAARAAGVSAAAPYRHFRDRDTLIADVARRGYGLFGAALAKAWESGKPDPVTALQRLGRAYLAFARDEPAYYAAMFEAGLPLSAHPDAHKAAEDAFAGLKRACEAVVAIAPEGRRPPALMVALHIWSFSHGIASLFARADGAKRPLPMSPEDLLDAGVMVYLDGLGLTRRPGP